MATILVVEDNVQNRYLVTFLLESRRHRVVAVEAGNAAVNAALTSKPDVVLLDIQLPGIDGYAVARAFRGNPALRTIPIVAVTSFAMMGDREASLAAGCAGYVEKPIDPDTFAAEIERYLTPESRRTP
jgi:CheY-like chemotaxis protein